jgi:hypothetical protein
MKSYYTEYEGWEPDLADLPPRSHLYPLAPIGIGTAQAECLTGYLMRLAEAHCFAPGTLYKHLIYPLVRAEAGHPERQLRPGALAVLGTIRAAHCWNGVDRSASNLVRALERLTCVQGLHLLTWLPWGIIMSRHLLLRRQRAWCPHCLAEWHGKGQKIYEPLLWTLQVVGICPIHDCALTEVCPYCRRNLKTLSSNVRAGHCSHCQQWLGYRGEDQWSSKCLLESSQLREQRWIAKSIGELIARAPGLSNSLSPISINENVENIISRLVKGNGPMVADSIGVRSKIISFWQGGRSIPKLEFILKFCYQLDLSVADFLTAMIGRLSCGTPVDKTRLQNLEVPTKREAIAAWEANVRRTLEAALQEEPPPPLFEIADRLSYASTGPLYGKYGELSQRIAARYRMTIGEYSSIQSQPEEKQQSHLRRRKGEKNEQHERERKVLTSALSEDPTPTLSEMARRLEYRSIRTLIYRFPDECHAIREKRDRQRKERLEELETKLRAALNEEPPRPLTQVAASLHYNRYDCYRRWREMCLAIAARHTDYVRDRTKKRRLALKEQIRQIVLELHQRGFHPAKERVLTLLHNPPKACFVTLNEMLREIREDLNLPTL